MTSKQFAIPELDDLMECHLYIGYCQEDKEKVQSLHRQVCSMGLNCSLRSSLDAVELSTKQNIEEGINFSQRCLLYVSPAYINDQWSADELDEAERKVKYFGRNAVVAIIEPSVSELFPDRCHLKKFSQFTQMNLESDQHIFTESCLKKFLSDFELKPILSTIPKSNIGVGVAFTYFYGFLQLKLPDINKKLKDALKGQDSVNWDCVVKKMLIIIPESVNSPPQFTEPGSLEQTSWIVRMFAHRSGRELREYSVPIYKLIQANKESYYFVGDVPACLFALYEAHDVSSADLSKSELKEARNEFCYALKALLNHPDNLALFANQWEMLVWPDVVRENRNSKTLPEFLVQQIEDKRLTEVAQVKVDGPVQATPDKKTFLPQKGIQCSTVYRGFDKYQLKHDPRGWCVIINNSKFSNPETLEERTGADVESDDLRKLFTELHFEVHTYDNLTATEMKDCLESYQRRGHSMCDAFVCCILSHGVLGSVCATDGSLVSILSLMELFYDDACLSLQGKPKLFFIGACQTEDGVSVSAEVLETGESGLMANAVPGRPTVSQPTPDAPTQPAPNAVTQPAPNALTQPTPNAVTQPAPDAVTQPAPDAVTQPACYLVPSSDNFIVSYATLPKNVAYADRKHGGLYVTALCKYLRQDHEVDVALKLVCSEVRKRLNEYSEGCTKDQKPFHICVTGVKLLFLCG